MVLRLENMKSLMNTRLTVFTRRTCKSWRTCRSPTAMSISWTGSTASSRTLLSCPTKWYTAMAALAGLVTTRMIPWRNQTGSVTIRSTSRTSVSERFTGRRLRLLRRRLRRFRLAIGVLAKITATTSSTPKRAELLCCKTLCLATRRKTFVWRSSTWRCPNWETQVVITWLALQVPPLTSWKGIFSTSTVLSLTTRPKAWGAKPPQFRNLRGSAVPTWVLSVCRRCINTSTNKKESSCTRRGSWRRH